MTMLLLSLSSAAILKGIMVIGDGTTDKQSRIRIVGIIVQLSSLPPC